MKEKQIIIKEVDKHIIFDETAQKKIGRDRAITYVVYFLENIGVEATFQRICFVSAKLFPESFSLVEFPEYPDSRTVGRCLWHCVYKSKGWLIGAEKTHYNTTEKGKEEISSTVLRLVKSGGDINSLPVSIRLSKKDKETKPRDKEVNFLREIKLSEGYSKFNLEKFDEIKPIHIRRSLGGDRYSPISYLKDNLERGIRNSEEIGERDVNEYLLWIKNKWREIMGEN